MDEKDLVGISSEYLRLTNGLLTDQTFWRDRMLIASTIFTFVVYLLYVFGYSIAQNMAWHNGFPWLLILAIPYGLFFFWQITAFGDHMLKKLPYLFRIKEIIYWKVSLPSWPVIMEQNQKTSWMIWKKTSRVRSAISAHTIVQRVDCHCICFVNSMAIC